TPLPAPVQLIAGQTYRVAAYYANSQIYFFGNLPTTFKHGTLGSGYFTSGDGFPTANLGSSLYLVDLRYSLAIGTAVPVTPTNSAAFVNGSWNGSVRVLSPARSMQLGANGANQISGLSAPFDVVLSDDIAVAINGSAYPTPV